MNASDKLLLAALLLLAAAAPAAAQAYPIDNIQYWVGSGVNRAVLIVDYNNGAVHQSLAWGYRWNGTATGLDMLRAVAGSGLICEAETGTYISGATGADPRLYLRLSSWSGGTSGLTVFGLGYDVNNNHSAFLPTVEYVETGHPSDPADFYEEGWLGKNWGYDVLKFGVWSTSPVQPSQRNLIDGSQDAWVWNSPSIFVPNTPEPAPAPLPGDANGDLVVDLQDFGVLKDHFGLASGGTWATGDFNADGAIDLQDFGILKDHFGQTSFLTAVPEPGTLALVALAAACRPLRRRRFQ